MDLELLIRKVKEGFVGVLVVVFCSIAAFKMYNKNQAEIYSLKQAEELERQKNQALGEINSQEITFSLLKEKINNKEINSVIYSLNTLAKESGVKIINIRPLGEQASKIYSRFPFELSVSAPGYHKLGKFVNKIERSPEFYTIDSIEIGGNSEQLSVRLMISTVLIK